jgi:hypothetical protein
MINPDRHMDLPPKHEDTKEFLYRTYFVLSCFRGGLALMLLIGGASLASAVDAVDSMIDRAVAIQVSLAHDKMDGVASNATGILTDATTLGKPGEKIVAGAAALQKAKQIAEAREAFGKLSDALVSYLDVQKRKPGSGVRVAYCPMARKPWLTRDATIQNPYYGSQMLTCGSFRP